MENILESRDHLLEVITDTFSATFIFYLWAPSYKLLSPTFLLPASYTFLNDKSAIIITYVITNIITYTQFLPSLLPHGRAM